MFKDFKTAVREELHIQGDGYKKHHIPQTFIEYLSCVSHVLNTEYKQGTQFTLQMGRMSTTALSSIVKTENNNPNPGKQKSG